MVQKCYTIVMRKTFPTLLLFLFYVVFFAVFLGGRGFLFSLDPAGDVDFYQLTTWTTKDGLPVNSISAITQTRDGFMWLGTEKGLVRFDGVDFHVFDTENTPAMASQYILCLEVDAHGNLWGGTGGGGVFRYSRGNFTFFSKKHGLSHNHVFVARASCDGSVWFGTASGLNRFSEGKIASVPLPHDISIKDVRALLEDQLGRMWVGTRGGGVCLIKKRGNTFESDLIGFKGKKVYSILQDWRGAIWIATFENGLFKYKNNKISKFQCSGDISCRHVTRLYEDRAGNFLIGTYGGGINIMRSGQNSVEVFDHLSGLKGNAIVAFFEDRESTLWFAVEGGGLNCLRDTRITTYTRKHGLSNDIVYGVFQDSRGYIWSGSIGFGVNRLDITPGRTANLARDRKLPRFRPRVKTFTDRDGLGSNIVAAVTESPRGVLWFGTVGGGLVRRDINTGKFRVFNKKNGLSDNTVRALLPVPGGKLWAGTDDGGIHLLSGGAVLLKKNAGFRVHTFCRDFNGKLWFCTLGGGLGVLENGKISFHDPSNGFPSKLPFGLYRDHNRVLWVGTADAGLVARKDGKWINIRKKDGLPDNMAYCIIEDRRRNIWVSSDQGIYCLHRKEADDFLNRKIQRVQPTVYGIEDGMRSLECNGGHQPCGWKSRDGRLWFPTTEGLSVIDPENLGLNPLPPPVHITRVHIDDRSYKPFEPAAAPPGRGKLEIRYTALSYIVPRRILFKYRLEGTDPGWVEAGSRRTAVYDRLEPGSYTFRVIACNSDGVWNTTGARFDFEISGRFADSTLFKIIFGLLLVGLFYLIYLGLKKVPALGLSTQKYKQSQLTPEEGKTVLQRILYLLEVEKVYKDPNVSVNFLSSRLAISARTISQVINEQLKKNFFELINEYRIKEAQKLLVDEQYAGMSILDITYEVGFNSRSAFNRVFKNTTGIPPSAYRKKHKRPTS